MTPCGRPEESTGKRPNVLLICTDLSDDRRDILCSEHWEDERATRMVRDGRLTGEPDRPTRPTLHRNLGGQRGIRFL